MGFYTGPPESSATKLVRLGYELQARRCKVWEHPRFGGVTPGVHIPSSKHTRGLAFDVNRFFGQSDENTNFDRFALQLMARGWGVIWNRQFWGGDHVYHLHVECITKTSENYDGRVKLKYPSMNHRFNLRVDGAWGMNTNLALQRSLGLVPTGKLDYATARALQSIVNTELNIGLIRDGVFGRKSVTGLQRMLGTPATGGISRSGSTLVVEMQKRLNRHGHLFLNA